MSRWTWRGSTWRPGQVHVGAGDQAAFVALERHPLGEHVVGVGQPRAAVRLGLVRELDAVLVEQAAGLRQVGHDRLVRVDQVRVRDAAELLVQVLARPRPGSGPGRGTSPTPPRSRTTSGARARAARRAAHGRGRTRGSRRPARAALRARRRSAAAFEVRDRDLPQQGDDDDRRGAEGDRHGVLLRSARGAREEDHAAGVTRDLLERRAPSRPPGGRSRSAPGSRPTCPARAGCRNSATSRCSSSRSSMSPSAISCSPYPGRMRRNFMRALCHVRWGGL